MNNTPAQPSHPTTPSPSSHRTQRPRLFVAEHCPYAQRVRILVAALQVDVECTVIDLKHPGTELLDVEPSGRVPVWVEPAEPEDQPSSESRARLDSRGDQTVHRVLVESLVIARYLLACHAPQSLNDTPTVAADRASTDTTERDAHNPQRSRALQQKAWLDACEALLIAALDNALAQQYRWLTQIARDPTSVDAEAATDALANHWTRLAQRHEQWRAALNAHHANAPQACSPTPETAHWLIDAVAAPLWRRQRIVENALMHAQSPLNPEPLTSLPELHDWIERLTTWPAAACVDAAPARRALADHLSAAAHSASPTPWLEALRA